MIPLIDARSDSFISPLLSLRCGFAAAMRCLWRIFSMLEKHGFLTPSPQPLIRAAWREMTGLNMRF
ncbi:MULTISPECIES: hypothetical protein [unclassified Pseudomonas]|uniref:hypothetical protein n=1 Tax=unclassified Pseudomonas TaxID=196821 RepID=UPI0011AF3E41|nr:MULTISPECIES: hypothetical protein [unclassified Pseudomonas]